MSIDAHTLKPYLAEMQEQWLKNDFRISPCSSNRASSVGHPCARFLVYSRTHWSQRAVPDVHLMSIFKLGWDLEEIVFKWLKTRLKLEVIQPKERDFTWPKFQLTGHLDCYIEENGIWVPGEIKGVAAGTWDTVDSWEAMKKSSRSWIAKWVGQLPIYLMMDEKPYGRFILFQKESGKLRDFPVVLDENLDLVEVILKRLEVVNKNIAAGTLPERFYEPGEPSDLCDGCDFAHICLPGSSYAGALQLMSDPQVEALLREEMELKATLKLLDKDEKRLKLVQDKLKTYFEGKPKVQVGPYLVEGKVVERKAQEATSYWRRTVRVIGG